MIIKVCGMRNAENIRAVEAVLAETNSGYYPHGEKTDLLMGFIFFGKSPRYVEEVPAYLPEKVLRTGVFVNESTERILTLVKQYGLSYVQLHGNESPEQCRELRSMAKVIKAFSIKEANDLECTDQYRDCCDLFLFDTPCEGYGGSGRQFEWSLLSHYTGNTPFLLSGGLSETCVNALRAFSHPLLAGYDLNSRFETAPAQKDAEALRRFLKELFNQSLKPQYNEPN